MKNGDHFSTWNRRMTETVTALTYMQVSLDSIFLPSKKKKNTPQQYCWRCNLKGRANLHVVQTLWLLGLCFASEAQDHMNSGLQSNCQKLVLAQLYSCSSVLNTGIFKNGVVGSSVLFIPCKEIEVVHINQYMQCPFEITVLLSFIRHNISNI